VDGKQGTKRGGEILIAFGCGHRDYESAQRYVEKFLDDLVADDAGSRLDGSSDQDCRSGSFRRRQRVEGVDENVCVEKKSIAHSFRPG
jgi:hypothetical protein